MEKRGIGGWVGGQRQSKRQKMKWRQTHGGEGRERERMQTERKNKGGVRDRGGGDRQRENAS